MTAAKTSPRSLLKAALGDGLVPYFEGLGFARVALGAEKSGLRPAFPLGILKRRRGASLDVVEIQLDKYNRPRFTINFGTVPDGGVTLPWGEHIAQDEAGVSSLTVAFRLHDSTRRPRWFQMPFWLPKSPAQLRKLAQRARGIAPEIEAWFQHGTVSAHMRPFGRPEEKSP